jgi:membrane fusion protein (multidrug efflux system)
MRLDTLRIAMAFMLTGALVAGCDADTSTADQPGDPPPPSVVVEAARSMDLNEERTFTGRIEAIDKVQMRARVQGFLRLRAFEEGGEVKKDDLLFEIEPDTYEIAVAQAEANLASAEAGRTLAQQTHDRTAELTSQSFSSTAELDTARSQLAQAQADVQVRQAALEAARLDLSYTRIIAPVDGSVGRAAYSAGDLVGPQSDPLVTIVSQDPMFVTFPVPQRLLLEVRRAGQGPDGFIVQLKLSDGSTYDQLGRIRFADVQASASTDSVIVRASIANPDRLLVDQQLVDVVVTQKEPETVLVVSQSALLLDQQGVYVLLVGDEDKVSIARITVGEQRGSSIVVLSGLAAGDRVIVSGHQKVQPGMAVVPSVATDTLSATASQDAQ